MQTENGYVHSLHALMQKISANERAGSVRTCSGSRTPRRCHRIPRFSLQVPAIYGRPGSVLSRFGRPWPEQGITTAAPSYLAARAEGYALSKSPSSPPL